MTVQNNSPRGTYDVAPDGRFLVDTALQEAATEHPPVTVVVNWPALLKK